MSISYLCNHNFCVLEYAVLDLFIAEPIVCGTLCAVLITICLLVVVASCICVSDL